VGFSEFEAPPGLQSKF
jgi:hypothetical protein